MSGEEFKVSTGKKVTSLPIPRIIVFVGTVGAGKSTQMRLLAFKLREAGVRVNTTFLKTNHFLAFMLVVFLAKMLLKKKKNVYPIRALIEERPSLFKRLFKLWVALDVLSIYLRFLLTIYLPMKMRCLILVEEYIPTTIADYLRIARFIGLPLNTLSFALSSMLRLLHLAGPMQTFFLDANNVTLNSRWSRRGSLNERPDYLYMQRTQLLSISKKLSSSFLYIETSDKTTEETNKLMMNDLKMF